MIFAPFRKKSSGTARLAGFLLLLICLPAKTYAGAFTQPAGEGLIIVSGTFSQSRKGFDAHGNIIAIPNFRKFELSTLVEYGVTDDLTFMFQPQLQSVTIGPSTDADYFGPGYTELGARVRVWNDDFSVFSLQGLVRLPGARDTVNPAEIGNTAPDLDLRALYGRSFKLGDWDSFFDGQLAYRARLDDPAGEFRADLTIGTRPTPGFLLLAQSFNTFADGTAKGVFGNGREHKVQVSGVYDFTDKWSVQIGGFATIGGKFALVERGSVFGLWRKF